MASADLHPSPPVVIRGVDADDSDEWFVRIVLIGYCTVAWTSILKYVAAYLYAHSIDPWLTRRFSPSMIVFGHIQQLHFTITSLLLILSPCAWVLTSSRFTHIVLVAHLIVLFGSCWCF